MSRRGYLILHEKRRSANIYYFSLEDGHLRYYTTPPSTTTITPCGEVQLSGCKIVVKAQKRADGVPNSFFVEARKVFVKDRSYTLGSAIRLELTACSNDDRQEWGKALFSWQRYYWRDPSTDDQEAVHASQMKIKSQLQQLISQYYPNIASTSTNQTTNQQTHNHHIFSPNNLSVKQPLKFLRRNATSLRRSFSMYMPSSASSTAPTSTKVDLTPGPEGTDCTKDKVQLATMSYAHPERGDNQEEYYA